MSKRVFIQGGLAAGFLVIAVVVILVIVSSHPGSTSKSAGPKNMPTNGISFSGVGGVAEPVLAAGLAAGETPSPAPAASPGGPTRVVTYIDWSCPVCKQFESVYSAGILRLVAQGKATLEIHPVAILDSHYPGSRYATRTANAAACVANFDPRSFLAVQSEFYDHQPSEGTPGLSNAQITALIAAGGVQDHKVVACVDKETFRSWVTASTNRVLADPALVNPAVGGFGTPTVVVDGELWDGSGDLLGLIAAGR